jgi:GAF domain-containing protein
MDSLGAGDVLYVGTRSRAGRLSESLGEYRVRWVDSRGAALALLADADTSVACVVADDPAVLAAVDRRVTDVVCLHAPERLEESDVDLLAAEVATALDGATGCASPIPVNEAARLDDLKPYLREPVLGADCFERLATLACRLLEGQVGLVGLVDRSREHIVAASDEFPRSLPREQTVCAHAILDDGPLVVEDVASDERFADNDLLERLGVGAYAGVPVHGRYGEIIGVVCVVDSIPRSFAPGDVDLLADLAKEVSDQFELRRRIADEPGTVA